MIVFIYATCTLNVVLASLVFPIHLSLRDFEQRVSFQRFSRALTPNTYLNFNDGVVGHVLGHMHRVQRLFEDRRLVGHVLNLYRDGGRAETLVYSAVCRCYYELVFL